MTQNDGKKKAPKEFVPTELGSAVFASVEGRPEDKDYLVESRKGQEEQDGNRSANE